MTFTQMIAGATKTFADHGGYVFGWAMVAANAVTLPRRAELQDTEGFAALRAMSDADLADIGLSRGDLEDAALHSTGECPTEELARMRMARHGW